LKSLNKTVMLFINIHLIKQGHVLKEL